MNVLASMIGDRVLSVLNDSFKTDRDLAQRTSKSTRFAGEKLRQHIELARNAFRQLIPADGTAP